MAVYVSQAVMNHIATPTFSALELPVVLTAPPLPPPPPKKLRMSEGMMGEND